MKLSLSQLPAFCHGAIIALDHCVQVGEDKVLDWSFKTEDKSVRVEFQWVKAYEIESEEPIHDYETIWFDENDKPFKIIRDIEEILERIEAVEIETISRRELLADNYFED